MREEIVIPVMFFVSIMLIFSLWIYYKFKTQQATQQTFRLALEKDAELNPEFMKQLVSPEPPKDRDLRRGMVFMALAVGLVLCGWAVPNPSGDALRGCLAGAAFPFSIGAAFLIMYFYGAKKA